MYSILADPFISRIRSIWPPPLLLLRKEDIMLRTLVELRKWNISITFSKASPLRIFYGPSPLWIRNVLRNSLAAKGNGGGLGGWSSGHFVSDQSNNCFKGLPTLAVSNYMEMDSQVDVRTWQIIEYVYIINSRIAKIETSTRLFTDSTEHIGIWWKKLT